MDIHPFSIVTAPTSEPLTAEEVMEYLRLPDAGEVATLSNLIAEARDFLEGELDMQLMPATLELHLHRFPCSGEAIRLRRPPIVAVTSIEYVDSDGQTQTVEAADYRLDRRALPPRIYPVDTWPTADDRPEAVTITYTAGYASVTAIPPTLRAAMLLYVGHRYENREATAPTAIHKLPLGMDRLLQRHRHIEVY